jgi:hypothetical protein
MCVVCFVLWLAGKVRVYLFMRWKRIRGGVRCMRDMCRRVRMGQGWFNIRGGYRRVGVSCQQVYLLCYVMRLWSYGGHVDRSYRSRLIFLCSELCQNLCMSFC